MPKSLETNTVLITMVHCTTVSIYAASGQRRSWSACASRRLIRACVICKLHKDPVRVLRINYTFFYHVFFSIAQAHQDLCCLQTAQGPCSCVAYQLYFFCNVFQLLWGCLLCFVFTLPSGDARRSRPRCYPTLSRCRAKVSLSISSIP